MELHPFQTRAVEWLTRRRRGLVVAPAGSGKTVVAAEALRRVALSRPRAGPVQAGWLCNTVEQARQAEAALRAVGGDGVVQLSAKCAAAGEDWSKFPVLVVDEAHHAVAPGWSAQIATCPGARWGFTATPDVGERQPLLDLAFGQEVHVVPRAEVASSRLVPATVWMLDASDECGGEIDATSESLLRRYMRVGPDARKMAVWCAVRSVGIERNVARNEAVVSVAVAQAQAARSVLVLVNDTDHMKALVATIIRSGVPAVAVWAGLPRRLREVAIGALATKEAVVVATSLADEGLDVPAAEVLVLAAGGRSRTKAEQRTGRVLRKHPGKEAATVFDFQDRQHRTMRRHALERVATYRKLGYQVLGEDGLELGLEPGERID